jgi:hypothetical protein
MRDLTLFLRVRVGILLVIGALLAPPASAGVIMFNGIPIGAKPNGFVSPENTHVSFSDSIGANLEVDDFGIQSHGPALACNGDDASKVLMTFDGPTTSLTLGFGNDDPGFSQAGDVAVLQALLGATQLGQTTVVMNRDDAMNQTITITGVGTFNNAIFYYGRGAGTPTPINLIEVVDDVDANTVPEPASLVVSLTALPAWMLVRGRRRR